jgi:hypothetical protein
MIEAMGDRLPTWTVIAVTAIVATLGLTGCGDEQDDQTDTPGTGTPRVTGPGLGLGEWSDDGSGDRRVLAVSDDQADADEPGERSVTALVEICAPPRHSDEPTGIDWSLVLDDGESTAATGPPQPTTDGSPPLAASGRIQPGDCAFADVSFSVPAGSVTVGALFHTATSGDVRWSWEPADTLV